MLLWLLLLVVVECGACSCMNQALQLNAPDARAVNYSSSLILVMYEMKMLQ